MRGKTHDHHLSTWVNVDGLAMDAAQKQATTEKQFTTLFVQDNGVFSTILASSPRSYCVNSYIFDSE